MVVTPSTMVMMEALETSHAAHGIPGAVDSNAKETFPTARKRPHLTSEVSLDEEAMLSNALINPTNSHNESLESDREMPQESSMTPASNSLPVTQQKKRTRRQRGDARRSFAPPVALDMRAQHQRVIDEEVATAQSRRELIKWKIAVKKLQYFTLQKSLTQDEVNEALSMDIGEAEGESQ